MISTIHIIVLVLGLLFGLEALAIGMSFGENLASAALQASGWWGAFSASHILAFLALKRRPRDNARVAQPAPGTED